MQILPLAGEDFEYRYDLVLRRRPEPWMARASLGGRSSGSEPARREMSSALLGGLGERFDG